MILSTSFLLLLAFCSLLKIIESENKTVEVQSSFPINFAIPIIDAFSNETETKGKYVVVDVANLTSPLGNNSVPLGSTDLYLAENVSSISIPDVSQLPETKTFPENNINNESLVYSSVSHNPNDNRRFPLFIDNIATHMSLPDKNNVDNVEESFTYQVKRYNRNQLVPAGNLHLTKSDILEFLQEKSKENDDVSAKNVTSTNEAVKKVDLLEEKIETMMHQMKDLEILLNRSYSVINATLKGFDTKLHSFTEMDKIQANQREEMRIIHATDKRRLEGQIQTLTMHLTNMFNTTAGRIEHVASSMKHLNSTMNNISHDIRMTDMRVRFNQKSLSIMDKVVQNNNGQLSDIQNSVGPKWAEQTTGCGGVLIGDLGIIAYKFRQPYLNKERCTWTVRSNRRQRISIQLVEDGFQNASKTDYITVTEFNEDMSLVTSSRIEHGNHVIHNFRGPLVFVTFFSDASIPGNGFMLRFKALGNISQPDSPNSIRYTHFHLKDMSGHDNYPEDKNSMYQPNELVTLVVNVPGMKAQVNVRYIDMEKEENCEYDSLAFYGSVKGSYALTKKYCGQQKTFQDETLQSSDGTFIAIFRCDGTSQFKGFQFAWESFSQE